MAGRPSCHDAQVDTTFTRDEARGEGGEVKETSWTTGLRIFAPNGDLVDVSLPGTRPNTSHVAGGRVEPSGHGDGGGRAGFELGSPMQELQGRQHPCTCRSAQEWLVRPVKQTGQLQLARQPATARQWQELS